jgi:Acetyltransferase (GNAT) domain
MSSEDNVEIKLIHEDSPFVEEINKLADENVKTLSFRPYAFYRQRAQNPGIFIALVDGNLAGYLIWSINSKTRYVRIWQLCIQAKYRGQKVARKLNNYLINHINKEARGIRLECRADYGIDEMWINLGYSPIFEKPAKTEGCTLKVWSIDFIASNYPSIFSSDYNNLKCSIDAYTLYKIISEEGESTIKWLRSEFQICITAEIFVEIDQVYSGNPKTRNYLRNLLVSFDQSLSNPQEFQSSYENLKEFLKTNKISLSEIEIRHIARCISSDICYFLTSKSSLLNLSNLIYSKTGVRFICCEDAIDLKDNNPDELTYQPIRLESANIQILNLKNSDLDEIVKKICCIYLDSDPQTLLTTLRNYLLHSANFEFKVLAYENQPCVFYISATENNNLEIPFIRLTSDLSLSSTLLNFVINRLVEDGISNKCLFVRISDLGLRDLERSVLENQYFIKNKNTDVWLKICYRETLSSQKTIQYLNQISKTSPEYENVSQVISVYLQSQNVLYGMDIERILWPLKIEDYEIPSFIIPIKPEYAKELFDRNLAKETLFGVQRSDLFLSLDRVYYKNPNAGLKKEPARILWYVSQSSDKGYSDLSSIRACSQVDKVLIDSPEEAYRKFQHLGYYNIEQVRQCASKSNKVMAIKFSHTELLDYPIGLQQINQCLESNAPLQCPRKISQAQFITLYRLGFNLKIS